MKTYDLESDLMKLIPKFSPDFSTIKHYVNAIIAEDINDSLRSGSRQLMIGLGIGNLSINVDQDSVQYRFEPSEEIQKSVGVENILENAVDDTVVKLYKDLLK